MIEVIRVAGELQNFCEAQSWQFCFIGGLALQRWGEPRETIDVDLTLLTGFGGEEPFIQKLLQRFQGRVEDAARFARVHRVLLLRSASGVGIDIDAQVPFRSPLDAPPGIGAVSDLKHVDLRRFDADRVSVVHPPATRPALHCS